MEKNIKEMARKALEFKKIRLNERLEIINHKIDNAPNVYSADIVKQQSQIEKYRARRSLMLDYKQELEEVTYLLSTGVETYIVPPHTLANRIEKCDSAVYEFDGEYIKVVRIMNFPCESYCLVTIAALPTA